jgi:IS5 family transposase
MKGKTPDPDDMSLFQTRLSELLNPRHDFYRLAEVTNWDFFDQEFSHLYHETGRTAKPIRLMVSLLILKQTFQVSDEDVCKQWVQNPYWQFFCGETFFQWQLPCDPSDLVYFRRRIGEEGVEKIFQYSVQLHGKDTFEKEVVTDTTVMEKNITFPTDTKLQVKIIKSCVKIAEKEGITLRQKYPRVLKRCLLDLRFKNHPRNKNKATKARKKIKTIAGRLVRELGRKLKDEKYERYQEYLERYAKILKQKKKDKNKIYSVHEPDVYCISKGKEHRPYEFGTKASIVRTKTTGVIVGAMNVKNRYDGHVLEDAIIQVEKLIGEKPKVIIGDRGYRGSKEVLGVQVEIPGVPKKKDTAYQKQKKRNRFRRRAAIEPVISHLKFDYGLKRCFLKGSKGDQINILMACTAYNIKSFLKKTRSRVKYFLLYFYRSKKCLFQG